MGQRTETVLLDAGGVLLDLDYGYLRRLIQSHRVDVDEQELSRHEARARLQIHEQVRQGGRVGDAWRDYFHVILAAAGVPPDEQGSIIDSLWEAHHRFGLWTVAIDGGAETVAGLKRDGYRIGVVSNAEGRVEQDLAGAGYAGLFETVVDSHHVGVEKPDPRIFEIALQRMGGTRRETTLYVGDVPSVDVEGARAAGIRPLLLDRHGLYADVDAERITSIRQLPDRIAAR